MEEPVAAHQVRFVIVIRVVPHHVLLVIAEMMDVTVLVQHVLQVRLAMKTNVVLQIV